MILVRTVIELVLNKAHYIAEYSKLIGSFDEGLRRACKNYSFSELYELAALPNVLQCEVQSVYPYIDYRAEMKCMNAVYKPMNTSTSNNGRLIILWSSCENEVSTKNRPGSGGVWSPNHFVPLIPQSSAHRVHRITSKEGTHVTAEVKYQTV